MDKLIQANPQYVYDSDCLRKKANWSKSSNAYKFDHPDFDPEKLMRDIPTHSSKLSVLLKKIKDLDKKDMEKDGRLYKHFIFSDVKSASYGAKLIAGALMASGMQLGYRAPLKQQPITQQSKQSKRGGREPTKKTYGKIELLSDDVLNSTRGNNFFLLTALGVYEQPITVAMKKSIFKKFNERPDNVHGDLARIIIMDGGYKEGVDLFDIKYVHIFEPPVTMADQRQVIGRGTRTCGQKGLEFHPTQGWPLHVFIYDVEIPESVRYQTLGTETLFDLYLKSMNIDLRLFNFQHDLERATVYGSVDYELNRAIHTFSVQSLASGGAPRRRIVIREDLPVLNLPEQIGELAFPPRDAHAQPMGHDAMRAYIRRHFSKFKPSKNSIRRADSHSSWSNTDKEMNPSPEGVDSNLYRFKWTDVRMENNCAPKSGGGTDGDTSGGAHEIMTYTPTQDFIRHFFTPENPLKGMLLFHSPGSGKTCSAIAAASASFEETGYTILWVTRTTLKTDIWKNMFDQICSENIKSRLETGDIARIPEENAKRLRLLSKSWSIRPMSYKQFSNMVSKANNFYKALVKKNGEIDPLRKTLLIIDEAHKLYGGGDLSTIERPDMNVLQNSIQQSYEISGHNSVRLLLMTATPITQNPMELIQLINLTKPISYQMPQGFEEFSRVYLDEYGRFTPEGEQLYLDNIAGHVSYLNRERDARQFAQPIVKYVKTPLIDDIDDAMKFDRSYVRAIMDSEIGDLKKQIDDENAKIDEEFREIKPAKFDFLKDKCDDFEGKPLRQCNKIVRANIRAIVDDAKAAVKDVKDAIRELKEQIGAKKELKREFVENVKMNMEMEDYADFKNTIYYAIKKCGKKINNMEDLREALKGHPSIVEFDRQLAEFDASITQSKQNLQTTLIAYKRRMDGLKKMMREDLSDLEKNVVRMVMKDERKTLKSRTTELEKSHAEGVAAINKTRRSVEKKKQRKIMKIRKTMREYLTEEKKIAKQVAKEEKALRKTQRKQGLIVETFKNDFINGLVDKYAKVIDSELGGLEEAIKTQDRDKAEAKEAAKREKAEAKEVERRRREVAKQAEKERKQAEREQQRETRRNEKAEKQREKLLAKKNATRKNTSK
jgi:hypothetical protein